MKRILITGAGSFVGNAVHEYLLKWPEEFCVEEIEMINSSWKEKDFSSFDVVYHVAGIAHSDSGKISKEKETLYRKVNTDLAIEVAKKAKDEGVKQFIFMSSAIVYGKSGKIGQKKVITKETKPLPENCYSDSKLQAEIGIFPLSSESFKIVVLRAPMVYGKGCKGNFPILEKFAKLPLFPYIDNERSMLYIGNLVEFVRLMIVNNECGLFWPQNAEYTNTSELVKMISKANGNKTILVHGFGWALKLLSMFTGLVDKAFGNLSYSKDLSIYKEEYRKYSLDESIKEIVSTHE